MLKKILKRIIPSFVRKLYRKAHTRYMMSHPIYTAHYLFKQNTGRKMNLKNPKDLNEKINWLKFYGDTSSWPMLADKWAVRQYVKDCGLEDILVKSYGRWDNAEEIDFDALSYPCVIKTNHASGTNLFLREKPAQEELPAIREQLNTWVNTKFADLFAEPHYGKIKPCILAEEMLIEEHAVSTTLIDYKLYAFDGMVRCIWACYNRTPMHVDVATYDLDWNYHPEYSIFNDHYAKGALNGKLQKPINLEKMIEAACILSKGHPQARVDFYEVNGKLYFGEMTMTGQGGYNPFFTHEFLLEMGALCKLPIDK